MAEAQKCAAPDSVVQTNSWKRAGRIVRYYKGNTANVIVQHRASAKTLDQYSSKYEHDRPVPEADIYQAKSLKETFNEAMSFWVFDLSPPVLDVV